MRRQYLGELEAEIVTRLRLFVKTPNNVHSVGAERDRLCPNPKANSISDCDNFYKVGIAFGVSLLLFESLPIDVPSIFWTYLLKSSDSEANLGLEWEDVQKVNLNQYNCLEKIKTLAEEDLEYLDQNFTTYLSDGKQVELFPGGAGIKLTAENRLKYIELCKQIHMAELLKPFSAMRRGFRAFLPSFIYSLITPAQLESGIVGIKGVRVFS